MIISMHYDDVVNKGIKIICVIPARGGSKGLPRKNIMLLAGVPLIAYTIKSAHDSKLIDRVIVSTEDAEIAAISKEYGAEVIIRPEILAEDTTPTEPVIIHAVSVLESEGYRPNFIVTLQPTSPFKTSDQIDTAIKTILSGDFDSLIGLKEVKEHPYKMKKIEGGYVIPFIDKNVESNRRQDMPVIYKENGAIYISKYDILMKKGRIMGEKIKPFIMSEDTSLDIDTHLDFKIAECMMTTTSNVKR